MDHISFEKINSNDFVKKMIDILNDEIDNSGKLVEELCVVFDIDGTLINPRTDRLIKPVFEFYEYCKSINIQIIIITARPGHDDNIKWTLEMLKKHNIETDKLNFMRPDLYHSPDTFSQQKSYKTEARTRILETYDILMSFGDMPFDIGPECNVGVVVAEDQEDDYINHYIVEYKENNEL